MSDKIDTHVCRAVTQSEIDHYASHGWVKLDRFISATPAQALLHEGQARMGLDGDSNPLEAEGLDYFNSTMGNLFKHEFFHAFVRSVGRATQVLMSRGDGTGMRLFADQFAVKLPTVNRAKHAGQGKTDYHQDFPPMGIDRAGGMTAWFALTDLSPEAGTMDFLDGSHRLGPLGAHMTFPRGQQLTDIYPTLLQACPSSGPMTYKAGDVTVHSVLCVHGAGRNFTANPRWAYILTCIPADSCWTGAHAGELFTQSAANGLKPWQKVDDKNFPLLTD